MSDSLAIEQLGQSAIFILLFSFFLVLAILAGLLWLGWYVAKTRGSLSPYTKLPMALGTDIAPSIRRFVDSFLESHSQPENPPIDFTKAAICPKTGRIFTNCVSKKEIIRLDWSFLQKRYPGNYVSWGCLSESEQAQIRLCHETMAGFQTATSCWKPLPKDIDAYYAMTKPGPLYVDRATKILLGWKQVHGTEFEVLIVQPPLYQSTDDLI